MAAQTSYFNEVILKNYVILGNGANVAVAKMTAGQNARRQVEYSKSVDITSTKIE